MVVSQTGQTHDCTDKSNVTKFDLVMQEPSTDAVGDHHQISHPRSRELPLVRSAAFLTGECPGRGTRTKPLAALTLIVALQTWQSRFISPEKWRRGGCLSCE